MLSLFSKLNIFSGLFRLWAVLAIFWVIITSLVILPMVRDQYRHRALSEKIHALTREELIELDKLRNEVGCSAIFDRNYPVMTDEMVAKARARISYSDCIPPEQSQLILGSLYALFGIPLIVFLIGVIAIQSFLWIVRGLFSL